MGAQRRKNEKCRHAESQDEDGCERDITAKISFISRTSEFTPPVIYSMDERAKLVFLIEARPERPERLRVGQPVSVALGQGQ